MTAMDLIQSCGVGFFMGVESEQKGTHFGGSALCEPGEILIWTMLRPLLAVPQGGCIHLENPCSWGPCMVPGAVGVLEGVSCPGWEHGQVRFSAAWEDGRGIQPAQHSHAFAAGAAP